MDKKTSRGTPRILSNRLSRYVTCSGGTLVCHGTTTSKRRIQEGGDLGVKTLSSMKIFFNSQNTKLNFVVHKIKITKTLSKNFWLRHLTTSLIKLKCVSNGFVLFNSTFKIKLLEYLKMLKISFKNKRLKVPNLRDSLNLFSVQINYDPWPLLEVD